MKNILRLFPSGIFILVFMFSCVSKKKPESKVDAMNESKVELCVGNYLTEEEGKQKLQQLKANYKNADDWKERARSIRENIYSGGRLDKIPKEDWNYPIKAIYSGKQEMDGYSVENVTLEMKPNYFVTGNLYKPLVLKEKNPAILSPHGHWFEPDDYGRFRSDVQYRCAALARMGAVVFTYDMTGFGEDINHKHLEPESLTRQSYNGIRILDYITSLAFVDETKIGITGASGGGTQTFLLAALDDRISVSVPVVMVSAHFYGGCVCESGLPIHKNGEFETNNVEITASVAPKPLMIIGDGGDWTKNIPEVEYPFIKSIYQLFDAEENVEYAYFKNEGHDYGFSKRKAMYVFMAKHLDLEISNILNTEDEIDEGFVKLLDYEELKAFPGRKLVEKPM